MTYSKRIARLPSSLDFDRLIGKDDQASREHLVEKYHIFLKNTDLLSDIIRQLTDINDKDREIGEKLQSASYRRFAFRQIKRYVNVCLNDLTQVTTMIDEDFMTSRLQRMGEMIKNVMESWDIMFHGIAVIVKNPNICTSLPQEIKLFYELSSIDMEEFEDSLGPLKEEIASRMSFCQLNPKEEFNVCMIYNLKKFKLGTLRFDKLILAGYYERSTREEDNDIGYKTVENKEDTNKVANEREMKTKIKRMRSCESNDSKATVTAIRPTIMLDTSCNETFAYDCDPNEGCVMDKSIVKEDFGSKHSYITAWAKCQPEKCLNRDSANSISSISGEDMDLDAISVEGKFSDDCSETMSLVANENQSPSRDLKVSAHVDHSQPTQIHCRTPSTEVEPLCDNVYSDYLKSVTSDRSDHVIQPTQPMDNTINTGLITTQAESKSNRNLDLKCYDKVSSQSVKNTVDSNDIARVTKGCNDKPKKEACRISNEILTERVSHKISEEAKARQCLKITLVHKGCGIWAVKTSNKRKRSESESGNCTDSTNDTQAILEESAKQHCKLLKRVKLSLSSLSKDSSSKRVKEEPIPKTKFKSLRRLATAMCAMKSRIISRPMLRRVATIRPFLI